MSKKKKLNQNKDFYRFRCDEVNLFDETEKGRIAIEIDSLRNTLRNHKELACICAPQLGYKDRIFCLKFAGNDIRTFVNPLIIQEKEMFLNEEKQFGFEDTDVYFVPRYKEVTAGYQTPTGAVESNIFQNEAAVLFEQMIQLLDGVFIADFGLIKLDGFDEATEEEKKEILTSYLSSLGMQNKIVEEHMQTDTEMLRIKGLTNFYRDMTLGNVEFVEPTEEEKEQIRKNRELREKKDN